MISHLQYLVKTDKPLVMGYYPWKVYDSYLHERRCSTCLAMESIHIDVHLLFHVVSVDQREFACEYNQYALFPPSIILGHIVVVNVINVCLVRSHDYV